jgi:hypothetical protein
MREFRCQKKPGSNRCSRIKRLVLCSFGFNRRNCFRRWRSFLPNPAFRRKRRQRRINGHFVKRRRPARHQARSQEPRDRAVSLDHEIQREDRPAERTQSETRLRGEEPRERTCTNRWRRDALIAEDSDGCVARVTFPAPTLKAKIDQQDKVIDKVKNLAGGVFTGLFVPTTSYRPIEKFREEVAALLRKLTSTSYSSSTRVPVHPASVSRPPNAKPLNPWGHWSPGPPPTLRPRLVSVDARHKTQLASFDISCSGVSKIEARLRLWTTKTSCSSRRY